MNAAFGFIVVTPTTRAWVFALGNAGRAGLTTNRQKAKRKHRMRREVMLLNVSDDVFGVPIGERINFGLATDFLKDWHVRAVGGLVALAACNARFIARNDAVERAHFAQITTAVRRMFIQVTVRVLRFHRFRIRADALEVREP